MLESAKAKGILLGRAWESRPGIFEAGGKLLAGLPEVCEVASSAAEVGVPGTTRETEDCWLVGEALRLEFLELMAEKSMRSSLLDSSCSLSLAPRREAGRPNTPELRMCRRSCLRLWEVIWLVEVKVKPQPGRMQWKWLVALL